MKISLRTSPLLPTWLVPRGNDVFVSVWVSPRASRTRIMGVHDGRLRVHLAAPPTDGLANMALVRFVAAELRVARAQVGVVAGQSSARKVVRLQGVPVQRVLLALS